MSQNESKPSFLEKEIAHSFYYNPRDTERILNIILGEKQIEERKRMKF